MGGEREQLIEQGAFKDPDGTVAAGHRDRSAIRAQGDIAQLFLAERDLALQCDPCE